ncbi:hypothetical protein TorRG33x02_035550 [Trema orientale]|uniref:Uncharacterized protein n=1 Tax=Trema orientale TaxID=63057 RepID=A0A2P5FRT0_TREOI|nr:hypothetical protein TorRG33x02_035550 [Trema orientale]
MEQARQVSCFVKGLKESICTDVRANKPHTLSSAIGLARLLEARDISVCWNYQLPSRATPPPRQNPGIVLMKRMTTEDLNERMYVRVRDPNSICPSLKASRCDICGIFCNWEKF